MRRLWIFILLLAISSTSFAEVELSVALEQIGARAILERGLTGKGVKIGVIDAGFDGLAIWEELDRLRNRNGIKYSRNFVPGELAAWDDGTHGTWVLCAIGGGTESRLEGLAIDADYYLARNEFGKRDYRVEEEYLEQALADMHQRGVRLVNISSGYTDKFEHRAERYHPRDLDGGTTRVAEVCKHYAELGMILVVTAGNEGDAWDFWQRAISSPADVEGVISVGATHFSLIKPGLNGTCLLKAGYSGTGPDHLPWVKPEVVCFSDRGCSLSTPIITGLIATMLELDSTLTTDRVKSLLARAGTLHPYPNNYIGYGVPDAGKLLRLLDGASDSLAAARPLLASGRRLVLEADSRNIVLFHKRDATHVIRQDRAKSRKGRLTVKRHGSARTTVVIDNRDVIEIFWQ